MAFAFCVIESDIVAFSDSKIKEVNKFIRIGIIIIVGGSLLFFSAIYIWNGVEIRVNIDTAREQYPGTAEEALITMLKDTTRSAYVRSHTAVWTLGQIRSEKALPLLEELYQDDPDGISCYGKHDSLLCQYEIHKAIESIRRNRLFSHKQLKKR
jgi:hypothetical protein